MKYGLSEKQLSQIIDIISSYDEIEEAVLFGSRAMDTFKEASDIDIAIKGDRVDFSLVAKLKYHFEEETYLPFIFDIVAYNSITSEELIAHINKKGKVIYKRNMREWREVKLGEIANLYQGLAINKKTNYLLVDKSTLPLLRIKDLQENTQVIFINDKEAPKKTIANENDLIFTRTGIVGMVFMGKKGVVHNNCFRIVPKKNDIHLLFYYYYFNRESMRDYLTNISAGSVQPDMNHSIFKTVKVPYPPLPEQKAIAEVLSSLDDKIDLLHRQNNTLEEMAQTLFRQWFIEEADEEWEEYEVRDFATHKKITIKPAQNPNDKFLHFSLPAFDTNKEPNIELGSDIKSTKYQVEPFSILISKLNPKTPRIWDIYFEPKENSICSTEFQVIHPNDKEVFPFLSTLLKSDKVRGDLTMSASGTSGSHQRVNPEDILNIVFPIPSIEKVKEFSELLEPNYLKIIKNQKQIKTLEKMRDTLLPKLMSGEVRVKV